MAAKKSSATDGATKGKDQKSEISTVLKVVQGTMTVCVLGTSGVILNRMSEKAKHELLMPRGKKTKVEKGNDVEARSARRVSGVALHLEG